MRSIVVGLIVVGLIGLVLVGVVLLVYVGVTPGDQLGAAALSGLLVGGPVGVAVAVGLWWVDRGNRKG